MCNKYKSIRSKIKRKHTRRNPKHRHKFKQTKRKFKHTKKGGSQPTKLRALVNACNKKKQHKPGFFYRTARRLGFRDLCDELYEQVNTCITDNLNKRNEALEKLNEEKAKLNEEKAMLEQFQVDLKDKDYSAKKLETIYNNCVSNTSGNTSGNTSDKDFAEERPSSVRRSSPSNRTHDGYHPSRDPKNPWFLNRSPSEKATKQTLTETGAFHDPRKDHNMEKIIFNYDLRSREYNK